MVTKKTPGDKPALYDCVAEILETARASVARTVNTTQVVANWLIEREIVEEEQGGRRRAGYGAMVLAELSGRLTRDFGRGYSVDNLEAFRQFYRDYEVSFKRHFYKPQLLRTLEAIITDILAREREAEGLLDGLLKVGNAQ